MRRTALASQAVTAATEEHQRPLSRPCRPVSPQLSQNAREQRLKIKVAILDSGRFFESDSFSFHTSSPGSKYLNAFGATRLTKYSFIEVA
jgi:hypothetical protein